ncbi:MAG TPA: hypothetical protein VFD32_17355 [Dehalococcoidia bacterium]|nr:hypothetical protein [Dehalococcoidia bacterium]
MTELLTVDEASERYANQWLLMRVHEYDEYHTPYRGEIIAVGKHRGDIHQVELAAVAEAVRTGGSVYVFRSRHRATRGGWRRLPFDEAAEPESRSGHGRQ